MVEVKAEAEAKALRPRPRPKFWPRGQSDLTYLPLLPAPAPAVVVHHAH